MHFSIMHGIEGPARSSHAGTHKTQQTQGENHNLPDRTSRRAIWASASMRRAPPTRSCWAPTPTYGTRRVRGGPCRRNASRSTGTSPGFQPMANDLAAFVLGADGNLWYETGPWGTVPPPRQQVDGNVAAFQAHSPTEAYVLGSNGSLWHETGPWGQVPPKRQQVDGNVAAFQALSPTEAYVLGSNGSLWHKTGPWDPVPPSRQMVGGEHRGFPGALSAARPSFSVTMAACGMRRDRGAWCHCRASRSEATIAAFQVPGPTQVYVLGTDGSLSHETGRWGKGRRHATRSTGSHELLGALGKRGVRRRKRRQHCGTRRVRGGPCRRRASKSTRNVWSEIASPSIPIPTSAASTVPQPLRSMSPARIPSPADGLRRTISPGSPLRMSTSSSASWIVTVPVGVSTAGTVPIEGSYNFNHPGTNVSLAQNWQFLSAGYTWHDGLQRRVSTL